MLFDWLVTGQVVPHNPAASVRRPKHVVKKGKTPVLSGEDARKLLDFIPIRRKAVKDGLEMEVPDLLGLRDRALIAVMVYSFARVSAVIRMEVGDYYQSGMRFWMQAHPCARRCLSRSENRNKGSDFFRHFVRQRGLATHQRPYRLPLFLQAQTLDVRPLFGDHIQQRLGQRGGHARALRSL